MKTKRFIAVILARSGSKGFVDKNIMTLNGSRLFSHSIRFAKKLSFVDDVKRASMYMEDSEKRIISSEHHKY